MKYTAVLKNFLWEIEQLFGPDAFFFSYTSHPPTISLIKDIALIDRNANLSYANVYITRATKVF